MSLKLIMVDVSGHIHNHKTDIRTKDMLLRSTSKAPACPHMDTETLLFMFECKESFRSFLLDVPL